MFNPCRVENPALFFKWLYRFPCRKFIFPRKRPEDLLLMMVIVHMAFRTGGVFDLSTAGLAVIPAACLSKRHPAPQVANELIGFLRPWHGLVKVGQEIPKRIAVHKPPFVWSYYGICLLLFPVLPYPFDGCQPADGWLYCNKMKRRSNVWLTYW